MANSRNIPLFSAARSNALVDLCAPLKRVLDKHWYVLGTEVESFEKEFAAYVGLTHCVSVANGSDALELALKALGVGSGGQVVTVANAGFYASTAIRAVGAAPIYVDIDPISMTICPKALAECLDAKPDAIVVTHLYGRLADIETLAAMAREAEVPLIEDCAQAHGAKRSGRLAGSFGDIGCFSFYPTKNLGALGDAGAVVTDDARLAARIKQLRQYGWGQKYQVLLPGGCNSRMDELQAAILREKLPFLDHWNDQRRAIARRYNESFVHFGLQLPAIGEDYVAHLYVLRLAERESFIAALAARGVSTDVHYPIADHHQPAYSELSTIVLPHTEDACATVVSLPCFPGMDDAEVQQVIDAVIAYFSVEAHSC